MALSTVGSFTLGQINIGLLAGLGLLNPLIAQLDLFLTGQFGLGPFLADVQVQFNAAISTVLQLSLNLTNPLDAIRSLIMAFAQLQVALSLALSFNLPGVSLQISGQISAIAALTGALSLKLGGIKALLAAGLAVKIPALQFVAHISAVLAAGPAHLVAFSNSNLATTGAQIAAQFASGLGPSDPISPIDLVDGILIVTKDPAVFNALGVILKVS